MSTHDRDDDVMAIADATGVTRPEPLHPVIRDFLADESLAKVLASWSRAAAGAADHYACEGDGDEDCTAVICMCPGGPCTGTTTRACPHHELLCEEHRRVCVDCQIDYADGGL